MVNDMLLDKSSKDPITIKRYKQGAIALARNESISRRKKHIHISYLFINDAVKSFEVVLRYIPTSDMLADVDMCPVAIIKSL